MSPRNNVLDGSPDASWDEVLLRVDIATTWGDKMAMQPFAKLL